MRAAARWVVIWVALGSAAGVSAQEPGLEGRVDVLFEHGFETDDWYTDWAERSAPRNTSIVRGDAFRGEAALRVAVPAGSHYGTSFDYAFEEMGHGPIEEVYFRYAIRLSESWTTEGGGGGKLPGFGGTYGVAGWGGRVADGRNGWSARGLFWQPTSGRSTGATRVGYYVYHADMTGSWGDNWYWSGSALEPHDALEPGRWYQIEAHVRNNTPGANDGILRAWVDGEAVFERTGIRFRDIADLHVEEVWMDVYYGGSWPAPRDMYLDIDNVVIALGYIGPVSDRPPGAADAGAGEAVAPDAGTPGGSDASASPTPPPDGSAAPDRDAATAGDPAVDGSAAVNGGCACGVAASDHRAATPWPLLALGLLVWRRLSAAGR